MTTVSYDSIESIIGVWNTVVFVALTKLTVAPNPPELKYSMVWFPNQVVRMSVLFRITLLRFGRYNVTKQDFGLLGHGKRVTSFRL